jgi:hypothetical protein
MRKISPPGDLSSAPLSLGAGSPRQHPFRWRLDPVFVIGKRGIHVRTFNLLLLHVPRISHIHGTGGADRQLRLDTIRSHSVSLLRMSTAAMLRPLVISGPSGTGKSTLLNRLFDEYPDRFSFSVSR